MIDLVFDTETSGFTKQNSPVSDEGQPYLVQLALLLVEGAEIRHSYDTIVVCPAPISEGAARVHGITNERSQREGIQNLEAIMIFEESLKQADRIVCYNLEFDLLVMQIAYCRAGISSELLASVKRVCAMKSFKYYKGLNKYQKGGKLIDAYCDLVNPEGFEGAHDASADTKACWKVLVELEKREVSLIS